jgi:hypothetical protein
MPGGATVHDGSVFNTPGLVVNAPEDGELVEARFVIFALNDENGAINDLDTIYAFPMNFHIWTDGIEGGADSFDENPRGLEIPGHISREVNSQFSSFITVVPFGHTGPPDEPTKFTTFLLTIDLSSFNLALQGGTEYVMGIIQDDSNFVAPDAIFRISASRVTGFEDVFRMETTENIRPGYVNSQLGFGYEQFGGMFTLTSQTPGDYDFDGDVDGDDYDKWRSEFGTISTMSDGNDDGTVNAADYIIWRKHLGTMAATNQQSAIGSPHSVPERGALAQIFLAAFLALRRRVPLAAAGALCVQIRSNVPAGKP